MKTGRGSPAMVAVVLATNALLLFGAVGVGLRVSALGALGGLPAGGLLDYSRMAQDFSPLTVAFIARVLGLASPAQTTGAAVPAMAEVRAGQAEGGGRVVGVSAVPGEPPRGPTDHALTNDDFEDAYEIAAVPFWASTRTAPATRQEREPDSCAPVGSTVWYRFRPRRTVALTADTFGSDYALTLGVFSGTSLDGLRQEGCERNAQGAAQVGFQAAAGRTYYFQVTAPAIGGRLVFNLAFQGVTTRVSVSSDGRQADRDAGYPAMYGDGRFVGFSSEARNLDPRWQPDCPPRSSADAAVAQSDSSVRRCPLQTFVRDRVGHTTTMAVVLPVRLRDDDLNASASGEPVAISLFDVSADGRWVAFAYFDPNLEPREDPGPHYNGHSPRDVPWHLQRGAGDVYLHDRLTGDTTRISETPSGEEANGNSIGYGISNDGRYVVYDSKASNLVDGDTNGVRDTFRYDRVTGRTVRVSLSSSGEQQNSASSPTGAKGSTGAIGATGRFVTFRSPATNLTAHDDNPYEDIFLRDVEAGTTTLVSVSSTGVQANRECGRATEGIGINVSAAGRYVLFLCSADNLVDGDTNGIPDLFLRDVHAGRTTRVTVSSTGEQADVRSNSGAPLGGGPLATFVQNPNPFIYTYGVNATTIGYHLTADGRYAAFSHPAPNLVDGDTNGVQDVFVRDLWLGSTTRVSVNAAGEQGRLWSGAPRISDDGRHIAFRSLADNLVKGDTNGAIDIFVHERPGPRGALSGWR